MTQRGRWQLTIVVLASLLRISAVIWASPVTAPDSERYRNSADPLLSLQVWEGQGPGILVQLVHLLPLHAAVVAQTVVATALWATAALYAAHIARPALSWPTFLFVLGWSLSPWFLIWDSWVLSEPLTLAGCALAVVGVAAIRADAPHARLVALSGLAVAVTARPFTGAFLLPLVAIALLHPPPIARIRAVAQPLAATAVLGAFATWQVLAWSAAPSPAFSYLPEPESLEQIQATDRLAGRGHLDGYLELARDTGMPDCPAAEAIVTSTATDFDKLDQLRNDVDCPDLDDWLAAGGLPWTTEFTQNPAVTVAELVRPSYWLEETFNGYMSADDRIRTVRELSRTRWDAVVVAVNAAMLAATALAVVAALSMARRHRVFLAVALTVVTAVSIYAWATDGIEYWRHILPAFAVLPPLAVTLAASRRSQVLPAAATPADKELVTAR